MGIIIFILIFVIILIWGILVRNNIVRFFNATKRSWAEVANFERQKVKTLEALEETLQQYTQFEKSTLENVTRLRQQILTLDINNTDVLQLQKIEQLNKELIKSLNVVVENYPELQSDKLYTQMMSEIQQQNENVGAAITIFNRNVEVFNNNIEVFPNNLVNAITLSKKIIEPFSDGVVEKNFEYKPNF
ncbi:LemA family protein [Acinetobacter shaoyimingii]|uniref:LemA family protein n=1 Tax=Acinetobacter shaoyimingii TaxID=2715164 RepID=A0A6G8RYI9_9GAMM|nr:LemA family protein [Acinetobacter shaoyimingii]QIO06868.1 LemA family protein [Acinetobacter shaoyimingii]